MKGIGTAINDFRGDGKWLSLFGSNKMHTQSSGLQSF